MPSAAELAALDWESIVQNIVGFLSNGAGNFINSTVNVASRIFSGIFAFFIGFVFSIYLLVQKETVGRQMRRLIYAYLPESVADRILSITRLSDKTFSSFLSGQCVEALVLGTLFFIVMTIFRFPYALMISVLIGVTALIPVFGAFIGCICSTRLMQRFVCKAHPEFKEEFAAVLDENDMKASDEVKETSMFTRILNSLLDGGKTGVDVGLSIIPGVLIISTFVMILTFGAGDNGVYDGAAYEGIEFLPLLFGKINFLFEWLFGFEHPALMAFPITSLGAVGAALSLVPEFSAQGIINGNAIAVFTAIGMCWSGYLSTHTAMLDALGFRKLTSKAIIAHTIGGLVAGIAAHWFFVLFVLISGGEPTAHEGSAPKMNTITIEWVGENQVKVGDRVFTDEAGDTPETEGSLARVIAAALLDGEQKVELVDGEKIDAVKYIETEQVSDTSRESLLHEVAAAFEMYRDMVAEREFGKTFAELDEAQRDELNAAIPYKMVVEEEAEAPAVTEEMPAETAEVVVE